MGQVLAGELSKIVGKVGDKVYVRYKNGIYVRKVFKGSMGCFGFLTEEGKTQAVALG